MDTISAPRLPAANEFSVGQLGAKSLFELLELIHTDPDRLNVIESVRSKWFSNSAASRSSTPAARKVQQDKRASNVISGMRQYGLLTDSKNPLQLSALGQEVRGLADAPSSGFEVFAKFLLRERHGIELLELARVVHRRDGKVSKQAIDSELVARGYEVPTNSSYSGKLRSWLGAAGLVDTNWTIDEDKFAELAEVKSDEISDWLVLSPEQKATIGILRVRDQGNRTSIPSSDLLTALRARGVEFDASQTRKKIYDPLVKGGWIRQDVVVGGRGGKGGLISLTDKGREIDIELIEKLQLGLIPHDLQQHLDRSNTQILDDLSSRDTYVKGLALELLSLRLASELGLLPVDLRLRSSQTGGAEVDLVAEGAHLHFSRWLFQCKNQVADVGLPVLAKELGMATLLRAQVVVIVTTGKFAKSVTSYARQASETTSIQVVLLDKTSLANYRDKGAGALRAELHESALDALTRKRSQLTEVPKEVPIP